MLHYQPELLHRISLQITTDSLGLFSLSSLLPGLRHSHALGLMQCHTYKCQSLQLSSEIYNPQGPHIGDSNSLLLVTSCQSSCAWSQRFRWLLWQTDSGRTHSVHGRFMYMGQRGCLSPSRHSRCLQGGTQHGDRACAYPPR